jgi:hypothetical protein
MLMKLQPKSTRAASRNISRAISHLHRAGEDLCAATRVVPSGYHQKQIRRLAVDLRALCMPIEGLAAFFERGGRL